MSFHVTGDYFESCTCQVSCPCIFLGPATEDACDVFFAWHIRSGEMDAVKLDDLNIAMAVHSPKLMTEGNWKAALYLDERADTGQAEALGAIFSGQAGGHLANVAPLIGTVTGVHSVPIRFELDGGHRRVSVGEALQMDVDELKGMDQTGPPVISNPLLGAVTQPLRQAKSGTLDYRGDWSISASGKNGFITEFEYPIVIGVSRLNLGLGGALLALAAAAWFLLVVQSSAMGMAMSISIPVYLGIWVTMLAAMMLPATAPLAVAYGRVAQARGAGRLGALPFSTGYLLLWTAAGLVPLAVFIWTRGAVAGMTASPLGHLALAGVLALAGLYQLSPLKGACLRACRSPLGFVMHHNFDSGAVGGLMAGAAHGAFCLGCCWALMAVLTVAGLMSLPWMAVLAVLILAEKNWRHGVGLSRVAGVGMVLGGILVAVL